MASLPPVFGPNGSGRIVALDRRVRVIRPEKLTDRITRVSELRSYANVVFLGEPGIGKSTVLEQEAFVDGVFLTVEDVVAGETVSSGQTPYLDALDEYRVEAGPAQGMITLAAWLRSQNHRRWRLACRSADWREEADRRAMRGVASEDIVEVQLLPLDQGEAVQVLDTLGCQDSTSFLRRAAANGAPALAQTPLGLRLLYVSVTGGNAAWPASRTELFERAMDVLAHEENPARRFLSERPSAQRILETAEALCLLMLVTGSTGLWRANNSPAMHGQGRSWLSTQVLDIDADLLAWTLDTALFRGEGAIFYPAHRSTAEFLGARALAKAVVPEGLRVALPLLRALSLMTGDDGAPISELRGLFAWFAVHLTRRGGEATAEPLLQSDSVSIVVYGDAAAFSLHVRSQLFRRFSEVDPFFRDRETGPRHRFACQ